MNIIKLEDMNFDRRPGLVIFMLCVVLFTYGCGPAFMFYYFLKDVLRGDGITSQTMLVPVAFFSAYLIGLVLLLFYVVFDPYRFRFTDHGMQVMTWRGRQLFLWQEVQKAKVTTLKGSATLVLRFGGLRRVSVPLGDYGKSRSLFEEIRRRIEVKVEAWDSQLDMIKDR